ncbi:MAG: RluA family pseudouridine synthase [Actinobacteria bacterium]|nr:MAG: RluA family pseudouridine synthase [Actinomycetota bacterium]
MPEFKYQLIEIKASQEDNGKRLDLFLAQNNELPSRSYAQKLIDNKLVQVNGFVVQKSYHLKPGDIVIAHIPPVEEVEVEPENLQLKIIYEDNDFAIVSKPAGMVTHPAVGNWKGTLVNALLFHLKSLSGIGGVLRPGIIHRLDKDTSGLAIVAKNDWSHQKLSQMFANREIKKTYLALVQGVFDFKEGKIDAPIGRHRSNRQKMAVIEGGKEAVTNFKEVEKFYKYSLVEAYPQTGRTHQIRVHFAYINHPIAGDELYGSAQELKGLKRQFLHAFRLEFDNPRTGDTLIFEDPLPQCLSEVLEKLRLK